MTKFSVVLTQQAANELEAAADWRSAIRSGKPLAGMKGSVIEALEQMPDRFPLAQEDSEFPDELRELHDGLGGRPTHSTMRDS